MKAAPASRKSSVATSVCWIETSCSRLAASVGFATPSSTRLASPTASGAAASSSSTSACVAASSSAAGRDAVGRADPVALGRVDRAAGHDQLLGDAEPDDRRQPARAADVGDQAQLRLGQAEDARRRPSRAGRRPARSRRRGRCTAPWIWAITGFGISSSRFTISMQSRRNGRSMRGAGQAPELEDVDPGAERRPVAAQDHAVDVVGRRPPRGRRRAARAPCSRLIAFRFSGRSRIRWPDAAWSSTLTNSLID